MLTLSKKNNHHYAAKTTQSMQISHIKIMKIAGKYNIDRYEQTVIFTGYKDFKIQSIVSISTAKTNTCVTRML